MTRVGKFGAVGALNTVLDFAVYNLLSNKAGLSLVQANIASTTLAMIFSFFANRHVVFQRRDGSVVKQSVAFFVITAFGLYVLQTGTITLLTEIWLWPLSLVVGAVHLAGLSKALSDDFVIKNGAKAAATVISLTWNYIMYKKVVFR